MPLRFLVAACAACLLIAPTTGIAEEFETITDEREFVSLIEDRQLKRFAINLRVTPEGQIVGRGFGRDVIGDWDWQGGYFCRDLFWGETDLGYNCQKVLSDGRSVRFIENQGAGRSADLRLN